MNASWKTTSLLLAGAATCIGLALWQLGQQRLAQVAAGVCPATGQVLSEDTLRKAVFEGLVNNAVQRSRDFRAQTGNSPAMVGVIVQAQNPSVLQRMRESFNNDKSFEQNFAINVLEQSGPAFKLTSEPAELVIYPPFKGGSVTLYSSASVQKLPVQKVAYTPTWREQLAGFGQHAYQLRMEFFLRDCCDNQRYDLAADAYLNHKHDAWLQSRISYEKGYAVHAPVVMVSTCGELLTHVEDGYRKVVVGRAR